MTEGESKPTLSVVHCVDTEGPLEEPLDATFDRLRKHFGVDLQPARATLRALQRAELDLNGLEETVARFLAPDRLRYLSTWAEVEDMVASVTSEGYRRSQCDPEGNPYCFSWFIIDVVGYHDNPRRKAGGFHAVWDVYNRLLRETIHYDSVGWHFHTVPVGNHAVEYNTCWTNNDFHEQSLARRLIERESFPSIFRAGGVIERNDLNFWLEQFIPFDFSSAATANRGYPGAMSDWRHAPLDWTGYHPSYDDYRRTGPMRRWIFRCLEVSGFETKLAAADVESAFERVRAGQDAVMAYSSHDRRDLRLDVNDASALVREVSTGYPDVAWRWANGLDAARGVAGVKDVAAPQFTHVWKDETIFIRSDKPLFGPTPFLAVEEFGGVFFRDNPTIEGTMEWAYRPVRRSETRRIGIAGGGVNGAVGVHIVPVTG